MTWTKLEEGGYDSLTGEFDTSKYDYYIADRTTKLQIRLTGAPAYNNGVLALDTICNNLYGNVTEIKLSDGSVEDAKKSLMTFYKNVNKKPKFMCVITANTSYVGYDKKNNIYV